MIIKLICRLYIEMHFYIVPLWKQWIIVDLDAMFGKLMLNPYLFISLCESCLVINHMLILWSGSCTNPRSPTGIFTINIHFLISAGIYPKNCVMLNLQLFNKSSTQDLLNYRFYILIYIYLSTANAYYIHFVMWNVLKISTHIHNKQSYSVDITFKPPSLSISVGNMQLNILP